MQRMGQKRLWQVVGLSVATSVLVALVVVGYSLIKHAIAQQTAQSPCLKPFATTQICYQDPITLNQQPISAIATSTDGKYLASASGMVIEVWEISTGDQRRSLTGHTNWITALAFHPQGNTLASSSLDGTIKLWNLTNGTAIATLKSGIVTSLAFSPDGKLLASGSRLAPHHSQATNPIQFWDVATQKIALTLRPKEPTIALAFSPDGRWVAAGDRTTQVWAFPSLAPRYTLDSGELNDLLFSTESDLLITGSNGIQGEDGIKVWAMSTGRLVQKLDTVGNDLALSPNGQLLLTTYGGLVNVWRMRPLRYLGGLRGSVYSALFAEFGTDSRSVILGSSDGLTLRRAQRLQREQK